jgi:hypothetical protein
VTDKPLTEEEYERHAAEFGTVTPKSAAAAMSILTHGKPDAGCVSGNHWGIVAIDDNVRKEIEFDRGEAYEFGPRRRTIKIELVEVSNTVGEVILTIRHAP